MSREDPDELHYIEDDEQISTRRSFRVRVTSRAFIRSTHDQRGSGQTTRQMMEAPRHAVYVWVNFLLNYPRSLAHRVGRDDLEIIAPEHMLRSGFMGRELTGIVLDHATVLDSRQLDAYRCILSRIRR